MSLVTKIQTIITTLYPSATNILSSKFNANVQSFNLESTELPVIVIDNELSKDAEIKKNLNVQKDSRLLISFLNLDSVDNTDAQSEVIIEAMEVMADKVAVNIYQLPEIIPVTGNQKYRLTPAFHIWSTNLTGVILEMKVNENIVVDFCSTIPEP